LDAVENGYPKPDGLDISWNPTDRKIASRKTRKFVLESVLINLSEAINQYIVALSKLPRFNAIRAAWHEPKADSSVWKKLTDISTNILGDKEYLIPASVLAVHWRNRIVHDSSRAKLTTQQKALLQKNEEVIAAKYRGLSVDCLLCHFEEARPTLKDVSTLIAMIGLLPVWLTPA
jgi:hypothetical protein